MNVVQWVIAVLMFIWVIAVLLHLLLDFIAEALVVSIFFSIIESTFKLSVAI